MKNTSKITLALIATLGLGACTNPETPAGHEGYVFYTPLIFGKQEFRRALTGPSSTGVSWRLFVVNIDMRARTYIEDFKLLTSDNLSVAFQVSTRLKLAPGSVQDIVENWGGEKWYDWNVKEPLRSGVRREVMSVSATDIQVKTEKVGQRIMEKLLERYKDTPVLILSVDIGHIEFPQQVTDAIQSKISVQQELERQDYVLAKAKKEAAIGVLQALKVAKKQRIISSTLDPIYVQRRAVEVYKSLAQSTNKTIIMLPSTDDGTAMPMVLTKGKRKILSGADEKLLEDMEKYYMELASHGAKEGDAPPAITDDERGDSTETAPTPGDPSTAPKPAAPNPAPPTPVPATP